MGVGVTVEPDKVVDFPAGQPRGTTGGGNGNGFDSRLRDLEIQMARIEERVAAMQENMARKNDVTAVKVWVLAGVLGGIGLAAALSATVVKAFF